MSVFLFGSANIDCPGVAAKAAVAIQVVDLALLKAHKPKQGDVTYLDLAGLGEEVRRKALSTIRRRCNDGAWGLVDPEGVIPDPAALFFAGASDYIGPASCRAGIDKARLRAVLAFAEAHRASTFDVDVQSATDGEAACSELIQAPFEGWKSIRPGIIYPFLFLYVSVSAQMNLKTRLGEAGYIAFRDKLRILTLQALSDADPLLWMETDASAFYLVPPHGANIASATEACFRMLLGAPLIGYERLYLPFPITFTFAMHFGSTEFAPPGKTGTIVSDAVNFSYHLGAKRAGPGRLTVSAEAAGLAITRTFEDLFIPAGNFEGRTILHSRRFGV